MSTLLTRRFGNPGDCFYAGNPLNRVSFKREDNEFLSQALTHESALFLPLQELNPAVKQVDRSTLLNYIPYYVIKPLIGNPFAVSDDEREKQFDSSKYQPLVVFLGLNSSEEGLNIGAYSGRPYFAVDLTVNTEFAAEQTLAQKIVEDIIADGASFPAVRFGFALSPTDAAVYAQARMFVDWNSRNPYCGGCGQRTLTISGGCKRACPSTDRAGERRPCPTRGTLTNLSFPRTDPTVIAAVVNANGDKILLGRNKRFPKQFYSCLAGFVEPAESIEEAVRREIWEEAGVHCGRVVVYVTQPWPYPANLMLGCIAEAKADGHDVCLSHDPELHDARWFDFDKVSAALDFSKTYDTMSTPPPDDEFLLLPGPNAVAHNLIDAVVNSHIHLPPRM
ncbi:hypothetical protein CANCADRAFT_30817 [Tortispora caseinolytica NRRL Y-17796]|uniref:NAD(+) diphosphatase n=1 Tax=Tortispora caseinolytica NRRL Y-17796 TaxID=767744 RepID=A0A1E4TLZ0_9ASCO|nr:hypothetical protein CANCADRAFT_30817 [Tortispora caseinolytica NRRL Y-17796]